MLDKQDKILIDLEEWDSTCGDGCCFTYGTYIYINGEKIEDEDGTDRAQLITVILNKLGYTNVEVNYDRETEKSL